MSRIKGSAAGADIVGSWRAFKCLIKSRTGAVRNSRLRSDGSVTNGDLVQRRARPIAEMGWRRRLFNQLKTYATNYASRHQLDGSANVWLEEVKLILQVHSTPIFER